MYWNHHVYVFADNDVLNEFALLDGRLELTSKLNGRPLECHANNFRQWQQRRNCVDSLWKDLGDHSGEDRSDVARELYNSDQNSDRDRAGISVRFSIPTVVNGRVYIGTRSELDVYGLLTGTRPR